MHLFLLTIIILAAQCSSAESKWSISDIYEYFDNENCIQGDIEIDNDHNIIFINGASHSKNVNNENGIYSYKSTIIQEYFPNNPYKPPVSILNEVASSNNLAAPYYYLKSQEGPAHKPSFTVLLLISGGEFTGQGGSIKEAKNNAAQAALDSNTLPAPIVKSKSENQESQAPTAQLNNIAMKLKMKVEYVRETYQPEAEHAKSSNSINLGQKKNYMDRLNDSIHKDSKIRSTSDAEDTRGPFTYRVNVGQHLTFLGNGVSKKDARHSAATRAIQAFKEMKLEDAIRCLREGTDCNIANVKSPISVLQELAQHRKFPITYSLISEHGLPHKKTFQIRCQVSDYIADGEGSSKKAAKKMAAMKMIDTLQQSGVNQLSGEEQGIDTTLLKSKKKRKKKKNVDRSQINLLAQGVADNVMSAYDYFTADKEDGGQGTGKPKKRSGGGLSDKDFTKFEKSMDYKRHLGNIMDDYGIKSDFINLSEGSKHASVLALQIKPKLICLGESEKFAAFFALKMILKDSNFQFSKEDDEDNHLDLNPNENVYAGIHYKETL